MDLQAKLANVLWRTGRRGQATEAFTEALCLASPGDTVRRAHLHTRLGRLEKTDGATRRPGQPWTRPKRRSARTRGRRTRPPPPSGWS